MPGSAGASHCRGLGMGMRRARRPLFCIPVQYGCITTAGQLGLCLVCPSVVLATHQPRHWLVASEAPLPRRCHAPGPSGGRARAAADRPMQRRPGNSGLAIEPVRGGGHPVSPDFVRLVGGAPLPRRCHGPVQRRPGPCSDGRAARALSRGPVRGGGRPSARALSGCQGERRCHTAVMGLHGKVPRAQAGLWAGTAGARPPLCPADVHRARAASLSRGLPSRAHVTHTSTLTS